MNQPPPSREDPREIARWAERYARSRTIPFLVQWTFIVVLVVVLGLLSQGAIFAYWRHERALQWLCVVAIGVVTLILVWFSVGHWGRGQIWRVSQWLYGKEGYAAFEGGAAARVRYTRWLVWLGAGLAVYHLVLAVLVGLRYLPMLYLQPLSGVYMVPFLAIMILSQRLGFWAWIWPLLYGLHGIAVVVGVPILFSRPWEFLNIILPIFGYGLLAMIAGHVYSRYALRRLKQLARSGLSGSEQGENGSNHNGGAGSE